MASQMIRTGWFFLKCFISVIFCFALLMFWKAVSCSSYFHSVLLLSSGRRGAHNVARFGMKRFIWFNAPINDRSFFRVLVVVGPIWLVFSHLSVLFRLLIDNNPAILFFFMLFYTFLILIEYQLHRVFS